MEPIPSPENQSPKPLNPKPYTLYLIDPKAQNPKPNSYAEKAPKNPRPWATVRPRTLQVATSRRSNDQPCKPDV